MARPLMWGHRLRCTPAPNSSGSRRGTSVTTTRPKLQRARKVFRCKQHVRRDDARVLDAGVASRVWVDISVRIVKGDDEHDGHAMAAEVQLVELSKCLVRFQHVDTLLLEVLGGRCEAARLEHPLQLLGTRSFVTEPRAEVGDVLVLV